MIIKNVATLTTFLVANISIFIVTLTNYYDDYDY